MHRCFQSEGLVWSLYFPCNRQKVIFTGPEPRGVVGWGGRFVFQSQLQAPNPQCIWDKIANYLRSGLWNGLVFFRYRSTELDQSSEVVIFRWNPVCNTEFDRKASKYNVFAAMWADVGHSEPLIWLSKTRILGPVPRTVKRSQGRDCCTVCFRSTNFYLENRSLSVWRILSCSANEKKLPADTSWHIW